MTDSEEDSESDQNSLSSSQTQLNHNSDTSKAQNNKASSNSNQFKIPSKRHTSRNNVYTKPSPTKPPFDLKNKFTPLQENSSGNKDESMITSDENQPGLSITCTYKGDTPTSKFIEIIRSIDTTAFIKTLSVNEYRITPSSQLKYREFINLFSQQREVFEYHTYLLKEDRPHRMVLRGFPSNMDASYIARTIRDEHGIQCKQVVNAKHTSGEFKGNFMPIYYIDVSPTEDYNKLMSISHLAHISCRIEEYHPRAGPIHCKRCQQWNHARGQCSRPVKCGICAGSHDTKNHEPTHTTRKCANCGENHASSWKGCSVYRKLAGSNKPSKVDKITFRQNNPSLCDMNEFPSLGQPSSSQPSSSRPNHAVSTSEQASPHMQKPNMHTPNRAGGTRLSWPARGDNARPDGPARLGGGDSSGGAFSGESLGPLIQNVVQSVMQQIISVLKDEITRFIKSFNFAQIFSP